MIQTRRKGFRTQAKLIAWALKRPGTQVVVMHQAGRFATPQPFDFVLFTKYHVPTFVESRTNAFGFSKPQTIALTKLLGACYLEVWMLKDRETVPHCRRWDDLEQQWLIAREGWR